LLVTAEEFEAARAGKPLPKRKPTAKANTAKNESSAAPVSAGGVNAGSR
jgi:hypothetical protein